MNARPLVVKIAYCPFNGLYYFYWFLLDYCTFYQPNQKVKHSWVLYLAFATIMYVLNIAFSVVLEYFQKAPLNTGELY